MNNVTDEPDPLEGSRSEVPPSVEPHLRDVDGDILIRLGTLLEARKGGDAGTSYVASLYAKGLDSILKKVGEEAIETILAAKSNDPQHLVCETADLWFHTLVMLAHQGLTPVHVLRELTRRFGVSGVAEKAARGRSDDP